MSETIRPTKKQKELLEFIKKFISENGYSPSYREIMSGLKYSSIATIALHVNSLISRGQLKKRNRSARSLEVVNSVDLDKLTTNQVTPNQEKWFVDKVEHFFRQIEQAPIVEEAKLDELYVLVGTLKILSLNGAAESFIPRLSKLKSRL
jgi:SOS-response transcriptional repressor LexA